MQVDQTKIQKHIYLGYMTGWTHKFPDYVKVQRFCLTFIGEARLWYESLRLINIDWVGLQTIFRQQYSKIGNTREQLFYALRSFHFDKNSGMIDAYVNCIRQVVTLLGYQEAINTRSFQKHSPNKIILGSLPHNGPKTSGRYS